MAMWEAFRTPPASALKTIKGGRLSGMTDIDPMWRVQVMTHWHGPCGSGWAWDIIRLWEQDVGQERLCFAHVTVSYRVGGDGWSAPVHGIGGSKLASMEKGGIHANDEGYKMAVTDALGTALKMLGVAADVYMGRMDASKYRPTSDESDSVPIHKYGGKKPTPTPAPDDYSGNILPDEPPYEPPGDAYEPPVDMPYDEQQEALSALRGPKRTDYSPIRKNPQIESFNPDDPPCPVCGGKTWDSREPERGGKGKFPKKSPKAPDFRCREKSCDGALWPEH
jgi:hypothetical protein